MTRQTQLLADLARRERTLDVSPARLERRHAARVLEAIARCCRPAVAMRLRAAAERLAAGHPPRPRVVRTGGGR